MTIMIHCEATNKPEVCTMHVGVLGSDGVRYGAMADIDAMLLCDVDEFDCDNHNELYMRCRVVADQIIDDITPKARVQQYQYCDEKQLREDERMARLDMMCDMAEQCERDGVSINAQLPAPIHI